MMVIKDSAMIIHCNNYTNGNGKTIPSKHNNDNNPIILQPDNRGAENYPQVTPQMTRSRSYPSSKSTQLRPSYLNQYQFQNAQNYPTDNVSQNLNPDLELNCPNFTSNNHTNGNNNNINNINNNSQQGHGKDRSYYPQCNGHTPSVRIPHHFCDHADRKDFTPIFTTSRDGHQEPTEGDELNGANVNNAGSGTAHRQHLYSHHNHHKVQMQISVDETRSMYDYCQYYYPNDIEGTCQARKRRNQSKSPKKFNKLFRKETQKSRRDKTVQYIDGTRPLLISFCKVLRPVAFSLTVCGMLTTSKFDKEIKDAMTFNVFPLKQIQLTCNTLPYCLLILLLLWFNFGRYVAACIVASVESGDMTHIVNTIWTFLCAFNAAIMFKASIRTDLLPSLFNEWFSFAKFDHKMANANCSQPNVNDHQSNNNQNEVDISAVSNGNTALYYQGASPFQMDLRAWTCLKLKMRIILNLYLFWTFCAIVHNCLDIAGASAYADVLTVPFKNLPKAGCFFFLGLNMLATAAMNLPLVIFVATCMLLCEHFRNISTQLQTCVENEEIVLRDLEQLRTHHQYMTNTLTKADKIFSGLLLLTFTANLPLSCLSIYSLTKERETLPIISLVVWLVVGLMNVAIVSWFAGNVVEQAHAPLQHIYNLRIPSNAPQSFALQVNLFLSKLDGGPIAFTLSSLASVTKSFAVTTFGVCFTYTAIAIQMSPLLESKAVEVSNTEPPAQI